ncbi:uncharacterized protein LOC142568335 [Dermacentor variabilis]|uniref:uncharacterized protein LOC142568335 n=1 Tax=Dermacentor variabilis TaxID=34621 RepID=UPI003F5C6353
MAQGHDDASRPKRPHCTKAGTTSGEYVRSSTLRTPDQPWNKLSASQVVHLRGALASVVLAAQSHVIFVKQRNEVHLCNEHLDISADDEETPAVAVTTKASEPEAVQKNIEEEVTKGGGEDDDDDTTAAASSAESSSAFEDLRAPLLRAPPGGLLRRRSLAARLRRLSRLSLSASGSAEGSSPEKHKGSGGNEAAAVVPATVARPPTKGILRRQKVHCCSSGRHRQLPSASSFGGGTESSEGSPEHRPMSPGRFCRRAFGRVFGLSDVSRHRADDVATTVDEEQEEEGTSPREPKVVSISEPLERSPSSRHRGGDTWRHRSATNKPRKPPLVFGGTFPIDEPVGLRGTKSPFRSVVEGSLSVATFPVDAFCCAAPNLCQGHAQNLPVESPFCKSRDSSAIAKSSVASTSESEPESKVSSFGKMHEAGTTRLHKHSQPLAASDSSRETKSFAPSAHPRWKGSSFLHFLSGESKVHKS